MIVYFSGTGNSRFAAEYLARQLGDALLDAGQCMKSGKRDSLHSDRPWVFAAPVYAWQMATALVEYIRSAQLTGNRDAYFVLTCGSEIGNAGKYAARLCEEKDLNYRGVLEVVMPENYIAMFDAPDEKESRAIVAKAKPILEQAGELIRQGKEFPIPKVGLLDKLKSGPIHNGILRPFDGVTPYRLEMQAKLKFSKVKDLYSYWNKELAEYLFAETDCIINLASKEYSVCVSKYLRPDIRFITCVFGEEKNGKIIEKGSMCKMARGEMVRYMAEHQITNPEHIRAFDRLDYAFDPARSDEETYVFVKRGKAPCSLD